MNVAKRTLAVWRRTGIQCIDRCTLIGWIDQDRSNEADNYQIAPTVPVWLVRTYDSVHSRESGSLDKRRRIAEHQQVKWSTSISNSIDDL